MRAAAIFFVVCATIACRGEGGGAGPVLPAEDWEPQRGEFEAVARALQEGNNEYFGRAQIRELRDKIRSPELAPQERTRAKVLLSIELNRIGELDEALTLIDDVLALPDDDPALSRLMLGLLRVRAMLYLRKAEVENCIARHNADCCIFPLAGGGVHEQQGPARQAFQTYRFMLQAKPDDLKLRWLYNLVGMALGEWPLRIDRSLRIPPPAFASEAKFPRFRDVAPALGVDTFNLCGGCIVEDFDKDGYLDIVTSTSDPEGPLAYYRNTGSRFDDLSDTSRLSDQLGGLNITGADYDDDGDIDLLVLRGAWLKDDGRIRNSLLRNNGDGTFTDVTRVAGLADPPRPTQTAAWGDYDGDGDLDVYIGNESRVGLGNARADHPSQLFRNNGDGTFVDVASEAGVTNDRYAKGVTAGDYDNDGDLDIYVSNVGPNRLYRNEGDGTFRDVALPAGVTQPDLRSFASWFFDYDNDGWLDLFVAAYDAKVQDVAADHLGLPHEATSPCLYRNNGDGTFIDVAAETGLDRAWLPMGANFGDLDSDGWLDIYLATGDPDFQTLMPNVMLLNDRGVRFLNVTTAGGLGHLQKGHGVAFADFDHDGDQDIYHQLGGFYPSDKFANALFLNPGNENRNLVLQLVGDRTNFFGVGTRITVTVRTPDGERRIHRAAGAVSSFGGSPTREHIGIGNATAVSGLEVWWPDSGTRQSWSDLQVDGAYLVHESGQLEELVRKPVNFTALK